MKFLTLFPKCENVHLIKDVGMIPFILQKKFGFDSTIASYQNGVYPYAETEVKGIKQRYIKKLFNNTKVDTIIFLLRNSRKYDILQVYHFSIESLLYLLVFKLLRGFSPRAKTYLKLDADDDILKLRLKGWLGKLVRKFLAKINLITIETLLLFKEVNRKKLFSDNFYYIPNGFYDNENRESVDYSIKENLIITVGRIGTYQKSNEILLQAFKAFFETNKDWKLEMIGPIESTFEDYIKSFFIENPLLINNVFFTGPINDRKELEDKYKKAKLFVLTSKYEGFPLVFLEAVRFGCTIISSDVSPAFDITNNRKYGKVFPKDDVDSLYAELIGIVKDEKYIQENSLLVQEFAYNQFYWPNLLSKVSDILRK
ncbi:glycosyltransferase [Pedobacter nototheniae]|uniref:glycosyltransferase n=1 Tax=Pedobacter nototheniae TaxID=2488994 RepID=UPI001040815B|nr:glycosyltransferase [Pedobacter nototheniae]